VYWREEDGKGKALEEGTVILAAFDIKDAGFIVHK
jgi:hypothetical protein